MSSAIDGLQMLKGCLEDLQAKGRTHITLSRDAARLLEALPARLRTAAAAPIATPATARATSSSPSPAPPGLSAPGASAVRPAAAARVTADGIIAPAGNSPAEKLASLRELAGHWEPARALGTLRDTMVFAVGNPEADLMLVGEAPGADEERQREPFVGKAGQMLTRILKAMNLERGEVYISNVCKFRPAMPDQGTGNRKPTAEEMDCCRPFVAAEIAIVRPKVIVALGASAAEGLLGLQEPVGRTRGRFHDLDGIPVMVTYHPSYLLRNPAPGEKRKVWEDMLMVMERLQLPITQKQRDFFR